MAHRSLCRGIAGVILTVGMAIDANVLVFERIREELRNGKTVRAGIEAGFAKAFRTIVDAKYHDLHCRRGIISIWHWAYQRIRYYSLYRHCRQHVHRCFCQPYHI